MKIENYGELLAKGLEMKLLFYEEYGSYSGDYIAILESDDTVEIYKGNYGSCSGCEHYPIGDGIPEFLKGFVK